MKLIIQPGDGVGQLISAIKNAKRSVEVALFRFDHKEIEAALKAAAAQKSVKVTALIASVNRGGEKNLRKLETRFLEAGITVARSADDLVRYHDKFLLVDRRILFVLSFNFTHLDIDHSRGFGIVTKNAKWVQEAGKLFEADCTRSPYASGMETFVVSPANSRKVLGTFLKRAKKQLLIYDPKISDKEMLRIFHDRAKAGVEIRIIGKVAANRGLAAQKLSKCRLHTRTIIRDHHQAFIGSQSLRSAELDMRRELGLIVRDAKIVKKLAETFESDWNYKVTAKKPSQAKTERQDPQEASEEATERQAAKAVKILAKELDPLTSSVKKAVRKVVSKAGQEVLHDNDMKDTVKKVVRRAVKRAVKEAVQEAHESAKEHANA